ncbi:MAG: ribose-phosphate diphosphokinase [Ferruginibacter sp.]|nr:ribose-phosphate diphosphokinase [Cytophagales bacterium]
MKTDHKLIFSTQQYAYLRDAVLRTPNALARGFVGGETEVSLFPDGERYQRILSDVDGVETVLIGGTISDADTLELYDLACTLVSLGAASLILVIPYFGYSTMERAVKKGEVVAAKTRAYLLSSIPTTALGNRVILLDLHTEGLPYYFEGKIRPIHLYGKTLVTRACRELVGEEDWQRRRFVLASTDAGRAKWVESLSNDMGVQAAFVFKRRIDGSHTEVTAISREVHGQYVIIYDDMIRTGSSLVGAAAAYQQAGARKIASVTTHGLFTNDGLDRIRRSGLFEAIVSTDSHPNAVEALARCQDGFLRVASIAELLEEKLGEL